MTFRNNMIRCIRGHRIILIVILCLFGLSVAQPRMAPHGRHAKKHKDSRVYLIHSDELRYDMYSANPDAQIVKGHVYFLHQGGHL